MVTFLAGSQTSLLLGRYSRREFPPPVVGSLVASAGTALLIEMKPWAPPLHVLDPYMTYMCQNAPIRRGSTL